MEHENDEEFVEEDDVLELIDLPEVDANGNAPEEDNSDESDGEEMDQDTTSASVPELPDISMATFSKHSADVFTVDVSPPFAASGGEDDKAYIWRVDDGSVLFECSGHTDSVTFVRFNAKRNLLATACMAGNVQIWKLDDFTRVGNFETGDLSWLQWHQAADILFCGDEDGSTWMYLVPNGDCKVFAGYGHPCTAGVLFPDGKRLCAGYADGGVRIWDLKAASFVTVDGAGTHTSPVTCIDVSSDNALVASGDEDGKVNLIHATSGRIITPFICAKHETDSKRQGAATEEDKDEEEEDTISVEAVAFAKSSPILFTGTVKGDMAVWDLNTHVVRQTFPKQDGVVKAIWLDHCVLVGDLAGVLRLYDARNGQLVSQLTGHKGSILDFALSPDAKTLVSASGDHTCKVFRLDMPQ